MQEKRYLADDGALMLEWDWEKNQKIGLDPKKLSLGSNKKAWWLCAKGHGWQTSIAHRTIEGTDCPYCTNRKVWVGFNDLQTVNPSLVAEWHLERNEKTPQEVVANCNKKVWWKCATCGHEWEAMISSRNKGKGCPECGKKQCRITQHGNRLKKKGSLLEIMPELAVEWHPKKNNSLTPADVVPKSHQKVWWLGRCGHEWEASVGARVNGHGCPFCVGQEVLPGFNDLASVNPVLAAEWDEERNGCPASSVRPMSNKKAWWRCSRCGNVWEAAIHSRSRGSGCSVCYAEEGGQRIRQGRINKRGSLALNKPLLAAEWHPDKNAPLTPDGVPAGSDQKVWWLGKCGHEWEATIASRSAGCGCPICAARAQTSFPEQAILYYFSQVTEAQNRCLLYGYEVDIYLPNLAVGIEYNGRYFHKNKTEADRNKVCELARQGIRILSIVEGEENRVNEDVIEYNAKKLRKEHLAWAISAAFDMIALPCPVIDLKRDEGYINEQYLFAQGQNSLATLWPDLAAEWDCDKNGSLSPEMFLCGSNRSAWWKCAECGNSWRAVISSRAKAGGSGCPKCAAVRAGLKRRKSEIEKSGSLATVAPELAAEWHPIKNGELTPYEITAGSKQKVWWLCPTCGQEWETTADNRQRGTGCPACGRKKSARSRIASRIAKVGSLATNAPALSAEWHPTKNGELTSNDVTVSSSKKVWWKCLVCEHEWYATISSRFSGAGCPACGRKKSARSRVENRIAQVGSLATVVPELAAEWHPTKNGDLTPNNVTASSNKKVWWKCSICENEWETSISNRRAGRKCPACHSKGGGT